MRQTDFLETALLPTNVHTRRKTSLSHLVIPLHWQETAAPIAAPYRVCTAAYFTQMCTNMSYPAPPMKVRLQTAVGNEDYTRLYEADDRGEELGPNARVWKVYIDETDIADKEYIGDNNATLDGILIFVSRTPSIYWPSSHFEKASLFSAIVATFVTQSYQSLVGDPQAKLESLLTELITVQRVASNGSLVNDVPSFETMTTPFVPSSTDMWINGLWFISLVLSLLTAFIGVLAKQWLYQYIAVTSGSPQERALVRQARNLGLQEWHVPMLIAILPLILHISLALFFSGLVILLHSILRNVAYLAASLAGLVYLAYMISNVLPILYPRCPYRTGLTPKVYRLYQFFLSLQFGRLKTTESANAGLPTDNNRSRCWSWHILFKDCGNWMLWCLQLASIHINHTEKDNFWRDAERTNALKTKDMLQAKAISWLHTSSYNPSAQQIVFEALSVLQPTQYKEKRNWDSGVALSLSEEMRRRCEHLCDSDQNAGQDVGKQMEIYLKLTILLWPLIPPEQRWLKTRIPDDDNIDQYISQHIPPMSDILAGGALLPNIVKLKDFFSHHHASNSDSPRPRHFEVLLAMLRAAQHSDEHTFNVKMWTQIVWKDPCSSLARDGAVFLSDNFSAYINVSDPPYRAHTTYVYEYLTTVAPKGLERIKRELPESVAALPYNGELSTMLRRLLLLVAWNEYHNSPEELLSSAGEISSLLNEISEYRSSAAVATHHEKAATTQILAYFVCTETFMWCVTRSNRGQSVRLPDVVRKTAQLLADLGIYHSVMASASPTVILAIFLAHWELASTEEKDDYPFKYRQRRLSEFLSISFAGTDKAQLCEAMIKQDAIPRLYALWPTHQARSPRYHYLVYSITNIAVSYVKNVSVNDTKQMDHIHHDDNLTHLCAVILGGILWHIKYFGKDEEVISRLINANRHHPSWVECYRKLNHIDWAQYSDSESDENTQRIRRSVMGGIRANAGRQGASQATG